MLNERKRRSRAGWRYGVACGMGLLIGLSGPWSPARAASENEVATYRWSGELVALDEAARTVTMRARLVTPAAQAAVDGLRAGEPIVITWSGYAARASGIRGVVRAREATLTESDRFLLFATFVEVDAPARYLSFRFRPSAGSLTQVRAMQRSAWATVTSSHRPTTAVVGAAVVAPYSPTPRQAGPAPTGTYEWGGELVALDEAARKLTVAARLVTPEAKAAAEALTPGDPIVITWSGFQDRADGIRAIQPHDDSGLWGGDRFLLPATVVKAGARSDHLTFAVRPPAESVTQIRTMRRGEWATLTSPHRPTGTTDAVASVMAYNPAPRLIGPAPTGTYQWSGELVAVDEAARELTLAARLVTPEAQAAVAEFSAGDPIVISWSGLRDRAAGIRAIAPHDGSGLWGGDRLLLPATFVSADSTQRYLTFAVRSPAQSVPGVRVMQPGEWTTATSPHRPTGMADAVMAVAAYSRSPRRAQVTTARVSR